MPNLADRSLTLPTVTAAALAILVSACGSSAPPPPADAPVNAPAPSAEESRANIERTLDTWHRAAADSDEERYFAALAEDAIFLGTDADERWTKPAFREFAHPHFAKGKAWRFHATARHVVVDSKGDLAWFDEVLATPNLGPARGSGVLRREPSGWKIVQYNLTLTIPNERLREVKTLLESRPPLK